MKAADFLKYSAIVLFVLSLCLMLTSEREQRARRKQLTESGAKITSEEFYGSRTLVKAGIVCFGLGFASILGSQVLNRGSEDSIFHYNFH